MSGAAELSESYPECLRLAVYGVLLSGWEQRTGLSEARLPAGAGDCEERPGGVDGHHFPGGAGHTRAGAVACFWPFPMLDSARMALHLSC